LCSGCASVNDTAPRELLNESNGSTLIVVRKPMVFSRSRTDVAANVRDYATMVAFQEDRAGHYGTWMVVHRWSTVDPRMGAGLGNASGRLLLTADGRTLTFEPASAAALLSRGELLFAPPSAASSFAYDIDLVTLRYIAASADLTLQFPDDPLPVAYAVWEDGRTELQALLGGAVSH
jgi:hypothetical protein